MLPLLAGVAERRVASPYVRGIVVHGSMHSAAPAGDPFRCCEFVHRGAAVPRVGTNAMPGASSLVAASLGTNRGCCGGVVDIIVREGKGFTSSIVGA